MAAPRKTTEQTDDIDLSLDGTDTALGSTGEDELRTGLGIVAQLMLADPEHLLLAI